ncbi:MAG: DUF1328 domain-containing protein [Anaerolineae bacterium]|nr:DUF1328 domain-containing protein [Anaerolineae bacterium]
MSKSFATGWSGIFFGLAILAAVVGFTGIAGAASPIALVLFATFFFLALAVLIVNHGLPNS